MNIKLGWKPSPSIVASNQKFTNFLQSPASNQIIGTQNIIDWRIYCSPVEDQSDVSSCSSNATVSNLEFLEIRDNLQFCDLSRMFLYFNARLETNTTNIDDGSTIASNFDAIKKYGVCSEKTYPYNPSLTNFRPTWASYREAFGHTLNEGYRIESSGHKLHEDILKCLKSCHPVVFGMDVYSSFQSVSSDGIVPIPKKNEELLGGHAMMIVGVDIGKRHYIVRNSWSENYGDKGYIYLSFDIFDKAASKYEFWVATRVQEMGLK